jgi:membrane protease YdiL (CAAX protease family)
MLLHLVRWLHDDLPERPAVPDDAAGVAIPIAAALLFTLSHYHGESSAFPRAAAWLPAVPALSGVAPHLYWFGMTALVLGLAPVLLLRLLGEPLGAYGLGPGRWRLGLLLCLLLMGAMLPVVLVAARFPAFALHYPLARGAVASLPVFALYEAGYALYFVGWELVFRSFLLVGLYRRVGVLAVYVQALPFALLHFGKPEAEAFGSIVAGVALGYLALRTRSFWWGALLHAAVAVTMDVAAAWSRLAALP